MNVGENIAHYSILSTIGTGGMGEVFLGEDSRLGRKAALKRLHEQYSESPDLLRRFTQEAKSASALNHPNIVTIYEVGEFDGGGYIAMEYVEGESVRKLINGGKIGVDESIDIAIQTANGLASAHAAGIIHRDIKPENLMRRPDGLVKILDFGLAKQTGSSWYMTPVSAEETTRGRNSTVAGVVMGTISYMSPEQTRGKAADSRTDIWSLGVVLYEMIAGRVPFKGESKSDTIASILRSEPEPLSEINPSTPEPLSVIVGKALAKDADERYQTVNELLHDLKVLAGDLRGWSSSFNGPSYTTTARMPLLTNNQSVRDTAGHSSIITRSAKWFVPAIAAVLLIGGVFLWQRSRASNVSPTPAMETVQLASWKSFIGEDPAGRVRISPDGTLIAYSGTKDGRKAIWRRQLSGGEPFTRKSDDSSDTSPIWSPDGQSLAYVSNRGGSLGIWAEPTLGGTPTLIAPIDIRADLVRWSQDGKTIYFASQQNLYGLNVAEGSSRKITNFEESPIIQRDFSVSPDETEIAYSDVVNGRDDIWAIKMEGGQPRRLTDDEPEDTTPLWHPDGTRIIYNSERSGIRQIYTVPAAGGSPRALTISDNNNYVSDISPDGKRLIYTSTRNDSDIWALSTNDGQESQITTDLGIELWPDISPDGSKIVFQTSRRPGLRGGVLSSHIAALNVAADDGSPENLLNISQNGFDPRWSPNGSAIAFMQTDVGNNSIWVVAANGGEPKQVTQGGVVFGGYSMLPYIPLRTPDHSWSPNGNSIFYAAIRDGVSNIWQTSPRTAAEIKLSENTNRSLLFFSPLPSADGRRVAWSAINIENAKDPEWSVWIFEDGKADTVYSSHAETRTVGWIPGTDELLVKVAEYGKNTAKQAMNITLLRLNEVGSEPGKAVSLKAAFFNNIAISTKEPVIAFVSHPNDADVLQTLDLRENEPRPLTSNTNERVYYSRMTFSPDGSTIYFGKQSNWQIVSMLENFDQEY